MFNLANYEDVDTRIHKFYETYPDGSILTELITNEEKEGIVIFKAVAYRTHVDTAASAIGYARGARKDRGVDRDFWFENCETSAIGRCLANLGLSAKGKRASSLEMAKVNEAKSDIPIRVRTESHKEFLQTTNPTAEIVFDRVDYFPSQPGAYANYEKWHRLDKNCFSSILILSGATNPPMPVSPLPL